MKKTLASIMCFTALFAFAATQVTKEYVDKKDAENSSALIAHENDRTNPHEVSAHQVGACTTNDVKNIILILDGQTYTLDNDDGVWTALRAVIWKLGGGYIEGGVTNIPQKATNGGN